MSPQSNNLAADVQSKLQAAKTLCLDLLMLKNRGQVSFFNDLSLQKPQRAVGDLLRNTS